VSPNANGACTKTLNASFRNIAEAASLAPGNGRGYEGFMRLCLSDVFSRVSRKKRQSADNDRSQAQPLRGPAQELMSEPAMGPSDNAAGQPASLQPSDLLNREAMRGKFSLLSILSTNQEQPAPAVEEATVFPAKDIIGAGLISQSIAEFLFTRCVQMVSDRVVLGMLMISS